MSGCEFDNGCMVTFMNVSCFPTRFFSRWETFVELVKIRRINQGRAEEFRRYSNFQRLPVVMSIP